MSPTPASTQQFHFALSPVNYTALPHLLTEFQLFPHAILSSLLSFSYKTPHQRALPSPALVTFYPMTTVSLSQGTQQQLTLSHLPVSLIH